MTATKITKSTINFAIVKATKAASEPPARKHVETLIQAVRASGNFIPIIVDSLIAKLKEKKWIVACKSLLLMHVILTQEKRVYEMLSQKIKHIEVGNVVDFKGPLGEPMRPVLNNYCRFMISKLSLYFSLQVDPCDVTKQDLNSKMDTNSSYPCILFEQLLLHIKIVISTAPSVHNESNFVPKQIFVLMYKEFIKLYGTMGVLTAYIINKAPYFKPKDIAKFKTNFQEFCDVHDNMTEIMISANDLNILTSDFTPEKPPPELVESLHKTLIKRPSKDSIPLPSDDNVGDQKVRKIYPNFYKKPIPKILCNMISDRAQNLADHYKMEKSSNMLDLDDIYPRTQIAIITSNPFTSEEDEQGSEDGKPDLNITGKNSLSEAEAIAILSSWAGTYFVEGTVISFGANSSFELTNMDQLKKKFYSDFLQEQNTLNHITGEGRSRFIGRMDSAIMDLIREESVDDEMPKKVKSASKIALEQALFGSPDTEEKDTPAE